MQEPDAEGLLRVAEVAELLALPLGTVKSRIRAGLAALRRSFTGDEEEGAA